MTRASDAAKSEPRPVNEANTRTLLKVGATLAACGIALAVADDEGIARWLALAGIALLVFGLHRFGRLGNDARWRRDVDD